MGLELSPEEQAMVHEYNLLTLKPTMYMANVDEHGFENNPLLDKVRALRSVGEGARWWRYVPPWKRRSPNWMTQTRRNS